MPEGEVELLADQQTVALNWEESREIVSAFVKNLCWSESREDPNFSKLFNQAESIDGFLYDLGHYERGMGKFSTDLNLITPEFIEEAGRIEITLPIFNLLETVTNAVADFLKESPYGDAEIGLLRELQQKVQAKKLAAKVELLRLRSGSYAIEGLSLFEDNKAEKHMNKNSDLQLKTRRS